MSEISLKNNVNNVSYVSMCVPANFKITSIFFAFYLQL